MGRVLKFIGWLLGQVWRWTKKQIDKVVTWARNNWRRVQRWIESGVAYGTIVQWILEILGLA